MKSEDAAMGGMEHAPKDHTAMDQTGHEDQTAMVRQMREKWLWTNFAVISLGVWLISSPFTFGYASRGMIWSDVMSGVLLIFFSTLALWPRFDFVGRWSVSLVGGWLQFAPLVFWAPEAVSYLNDTLVGVIAIVLSILVPMMPGMAHHMEMKKPGPLIPPGWTYNPSSWHQRAPMIGLAFIGWLASRYLAAFQLGYITTIWDPFFGGGTVNVLTSDVSKAFPISDAGLGATAYTIEMLMGWMGGKERWRSMPWMVTFFFILVVPLGMVSITLIILQPLAVGSWCSICLFTALVMLTMIPFAVDEVVATLQFLKRSVHEGKPLWRTFWVGGTLAEVNEDQRTPKYGASVSKHAGPMAWGVTVPWNLVASGALGIWLMFSPAVFGTQAGAADSDHVVGALITAVAVIVMAEVIRAGRFLNVLLGAWIIAAPWLLSGAGTTARWNDVLAGAVVILLSLPRGPVRERYAGWNRFIV
ncbi:MAG: vitamin K epoxide reductase family protein [Spartobacteria bacterium]